MAANGEMYFKARLKAIDITDETAPTELLTLDSAPDAELHNDFSATVVVDGFQGGFGLFFYRQELGDPCMTNYDGLVSPGLGIAPTQVTLSSSPFPSMRFDFTDGMGHYVEATRFTQPGWLLASWSQPVVTAASCVSCQGADYGLVTMATRVRP